MIPSIIRCRGGHITASGAFIIPPVFFPACARHPDRLVGAGWRTSAAKILDNAVVAYCRVEHLTCAA
jgi:hypothetical protein